MTGSLCILTTFCQFPLPQHPASGNHKPKLFFYELGGCFVWDSTWTWDHTVVVFLQWISLSIMPFRSIYVVTNGRCLHQQSKENEQITWTPILHLEKVSVALFPHSLSQGTQLPLLVLRMTQRERQAAGTWCTQGHSTQKRGGWGEGRTLSQQLPGSTCSRSQETHMTINVLMDPSHSIPFAPLVAQLS